MKRCPQCEFIYEDDQSLCDMDGVLLVFDSRTLPTDHALTTVPAKTQPKRHRAVPAFATLILALVLSMVYYVSTQRKGAQSAYTAPPSATTTINAVTVPVPEVNPTPEAQPSETLQPEEVSEPKAARKAVTVPAVKKPTAKVTSTTQVKTTTETRKDESKVGSILKKTGRILKKPFKF